MKSYNELTISSMCKHFSFPAFGIQAEKLFSLQKQIIFNAPNCLLRFPIAFNFFNINKIASNEY